MENEDSKNKKPKEKTPDLGFCDPEHFKNFNEMMKNCCQAINDCSGHSKMVSVMMKVMQRNDTA